MDSCGVLDTTQERWDHGVVLTDYFIILFIQLALFKRYTSVDTDVLISIVLRLFFGPCIF